MVFPNLPRGIYITRNVSPDQPSEPSGSDSFPGSHIQDSNNLLQSVKKPEDELSETDRTRDSGVISTDDCDNMESKEAIAAQIEMMQSSSFANSELTDASQTTIGDNSRIGDQVLSNLNISSLHNSASQEISPENKTDGETDSIAEYFKICDNNTRQTFLDVMRNDREQHMSALDKINTELKSVKHQLQQTKSEHILKEQQLEEVMKEMNQLQMEVMNLHSRCTELSNQEKTLQKKLKTYTKKVSLCDSALNAMTNER
ncbi:unnamed protein product [Acanthosepion pharaonis]|uniref:Uncharacterized protein n=1 Tax=Acanthosepion pharaonis TaxID=158019 RepID=A0A812DSS6_ACAPH|nr:unnamed protein product [Sepia pharaonis]